MYRKLENKKGGFHMKGALVKKVSALTELAQEVTEYASQAKASNTVKAYQSDWFGVNP